VNGGRTAVDARASRVVPADSRGFRLQAEELMRQAACSASSDALNRPPRYIVTAAPLDIGAITQKLCIAVDPTDTHGIWWWEAGHRGCSTRSTGPDVFHAESAAVVRQPSGAIDCRFRLPLIAMPGSAVVADVAFWPRRPVRAYPSRGELTSGCPSECRERSATGRYSFRLKCLL
jgi:hypothetical protein